MRRDFSTCSSRICYASCWANTDCHIMLQQYAEPTRTNIYVRTRSYISVMFGFVILRNQKSPAAAAADVAAATTTETVAAATAVGHTRPGSASLYVRLVGLTVAPFVLVHVLDICCMFPASHLEFLHNNLETKHLQREMSNRESFS